MRIGRHHRRRLTAATGARRPRPAAPLLVVPPFSADHGLGLWLNRRRAAGQARHAELVLPEGWVEPPLGEATGPRRSRTDPPCWLWPPPVSEDP